MVNIPQLAAAIHSDELAAFSQEEAFSHRDKIKRILSQHLAGQPGSWWLERLHAKDMWAIEVFDWKRLTEHEGYRSLEIEQPITTIGGKSLLTTRCPIRIDGEILFSDKPAPALGQDNERILMELIK
jgi:crotonobetainyl-CoA:carnitine CoA-transferase CaiB-like acyl-CoA transferase